MRISIRPRTRSLIPSTLVIRALTQQGPHYACDDCGEKMFVRYASGLCPICFNHGSATCDGTVREVPHELALVGVIDDPAIEELSAH